MVQESGPNQEIEILFHIYFPITECDFLRLVIQVQEWQVWESKLTLKCCSNQVAKHESILIQNLKWITNLRLKVTFLIEFNFVKMRTSQFVNRTFKSMKLVKFNMMIIKDGRFNFIMNWYRIQCWLGKRLKSGEDTGVIIESGSRIESPSWGSGSYSFSSSISGKG